MPNSRELKKLLKPLLLRRPDLAFERRFLFFRPLTHYLRGVAFVVKGYGAGDAEAVSFAGPLFDGQPDHPDFGTGQTGYTYYLKDWRQQDFETLSHDFSDRMEREALPQVEGITEPRKDPNSDPHAKDGRTYNFRGLLNACYYGEYGLARQLCPPYGQDDRPPLEKGPITEEFKYDFDLWKRASYLAKMLHENEAGVPQLLHDWERHSVETMKFAKHWKSSLFPCEQTSG